MPELLTIFFLFAAGRVSHEGRSAGSEQRTEGSEIKARVSIPLFMASRVYTSLILVKVGPSEKQTIEKAPVPVSFCIQPFS